jgi:hypothetical protein
MEPNGKLFLDHLHSSFVVCTGGCWFNVALLALEHMTILSWLKCSISNCFQIFKNNLKIRSSAQDSNASELQINLKTKSRTKKINKYQSATTKLWTF